MTRNLDRLVDSLDSFPDVDVDEVAGLLERAQLDELTDEDTARIAELLTEASEWCSQFLTDWINDLVDVANIHNRARSDFLDGVLGSLFGSAAGLLKNFGALFGLGGREPDHGDHPDCPDN